ncbi:MAG: recombination regulator RecX [Burkholderiaceae bacterium]
MSAGASPRGVSAAPRSLMSRAVAMLARREHSRIELARKLKRYLEPEQEAAELEQVLDELERRQLLSDARYASAVVRSRSARYGDARLRQELKASGVNASEVAAAVESLHGTEIERARAVWQRRYSDRPTTREDHAKQARFLQARGFSLDTIRRVLGGRHCDDES